MRRWAANRLTVGARQSGSLGSPTRVTRRHQSSLAQVTSPGKRASKAFPSADNHDKRPQPSSSKQKTSSPQSATSATVDPYELLAPELLRLRKTLLKLLGSSHPSLTKIAEYYFLQPSKQIRPLLVLLFARATNGLGGDWDEKLWATEHENARGREEELDYPLSRPDVLNDWNPNMPGHTASFDSTFDLLPPWSRGAAPMYPATRAQETPSPSLTDAPLLPTQVRLAQIVEMIHVASLLHDDVIDKAALRRSAASAPAAFGNKLSVLAGNFLLGRASAALSRLNSSETIELISSVISNLVEGEILQMKAAVADCAGDTQTLSKLGLVEAGLIQRVPVRGTSVNRQMWNIYLHKSYLKTASLIAKSARAAVVLGGAREGEIWKEVAYAYGRNIGIAFQVCSPSILFFSNDAADLVIRCARGGSACALSGI